MHCKPWADHRGDVRGVQYVWVRSGLLEAGERGLWVVPLAINMLTAWEVYTVDCDCQSPFPQYFDLVSIINDDMAVPCLL